MRATHFPMVMSFGIISIAVITISVTADENGPVVTAARSSSESGALGQNQAGAAGHALIGWAALPRRRARRVRRPDSSSRRPTAWCRPS
jgi:hypothetical protein